MRGRFIVFEGPDRAGKTTQVGMLARRLGGRALVVREPGGTPVGESIRGLLLDHRSRLDIRTELFLYMASRAELVARRIEPALSSGRTVLCDRYLYSSAAYQGAAGGIGVRPVLDVGRVATGGRLPDLTVFLDLDPRAAFARGPRTRDRIERRSLAYHVRVRNAFRSLARTLGRRALLVDASADPAEVHRAVWEALP